MKKKQHYFWRKGLWSIINFSFLIIAIIVLLVVYVESQLPEVEALKTVQLQVPLRIFSKEGLLIQEYGEKRRIPVAYKDIPKTLVYALVVTEDQRFFDHPGVDIFGLSRAALKMLATGTKSQGGSTITMQVARNFFLNRKKTFLRKFNEILLAIKIDHELPKEKILELYLNKVYLGNRAYGVGAAAQIYYGKPLKSLSVAQLAMIAGLPQAPSIANPITNPAAAKKRRNHVLGRLLEEKYITPAEYQQAIAEPLNASMHEANIQVNAPYVAEMIRESLFNNFGPEAYTKGYEVYTTIDAKLQKTANQVIESHLLQYDKRHGFRGPISHIKSFMQLRIYPTMASLVPAMVIHVEPQNIHLKTQKGESIQIPTHGFSWARPALKHGYVGRSPQSAKNMLIAGDVVYVKQGDKGWELSQIPEVEGALVALNPKDGSIEALVGGFNFHKSKYNRVTQSTRQPGSSFKSFVYAAALNKGYTLSTLINDAPIVVPDPSLGGYWRPHNVKHTFNGPTRLKDALVHSVNLVAIRILDGIGIPYAVDYISRFGFQKSSMPKTLSLALGSLSVSPMDLTIAYAVFANGGYKIQPYLIDHISNLNGNVLLQAKPISVPQDGRHTDPSLIAPRVISSEVAFLINSALMTVIEKGTGSSAKSLGRHDLAGKTGTTNDQVDAWFSGYNADLVVTTWMGYDNPSSLHAYAAQLALPIWIDFMKTALANKPDHMMPQPENIIAIPINAKSGLRADAHDHQAIMEYFKSDVLPDIDEAFISSETQNAANTAPQEDLF